MLAMTKRRYPVVPIIAFLFLGACATLPSGPHVQVMPGTGKNMTQFKVDDAQCRDNAIGTVRAMMPGSGQEAPGTGAGKPVETVAAESDTSSSGLQRRYDFVYIQCMYAKGHRVPVLNRSQP